MTAMLTEAVPDVDGHAAHRDAQRLRRAGVQARVAGERVGATAPSQWYGGAATAFDVARAELSGFLVDVALVASRASEAVAEYAEAAPAAVRRMQAAADDYAAAVLALELDPVSVRAPQLRDEAVAAFESAKQQYRAALEAAVDVLAGLPELASPPSQGPGRHLGAAASRFWSESVAGPATFAWQLTAGFVQDRDGWQAMVSALPGGYLDMARNPVRTAQDAVAWDDWASGEWGAAVGTGLGMMLPSRRLADLGPTEARQRFTRNMADPDAPRPRTQTVEELLAGADLSCSEHAAFGHTARRHVDADDAYLQDRLLYGTLQDDGTRRDPPRSGNASAWASRAVAEEIITMVLAAHQGSIRDWVATGVDGRRSFSLEADPTVGRVMHYRDGAFGLAPPDRALVILQKRGHEVFIYTAYPDIGRPS